MSESLFSPIWYRYSQQRPQLRAHTRVQPQKYRDQTWYLIINDSNGNHYRINHIAYAFIGRCDGNFSVQAIWEHLLATMGDEALTQDEVIKLLSELDQRDLLRYEVIPDIPKLFKRKKLKDKQTRKQFINPLAFRLPLWNPVNVLDNLGWLQKVIFNPISLALWLLLIGVAAISAMSHFDELALHAQQYMSTQRYLLLAWLSFPLLKGLHELGHGLAVHRWGGKAKEAGITFFILTPAPYVDASASAGFRSRGQRIIVGAIGIMIELLIAAFALAIWFSTQSGLVHDLAFVVMFICGISSIVFNGNPLLRFDAYYILCDALDLPNLAARSKTFWSQGISNLILGKLKWSSMAMAKGEQKWLWLYAPLSLLYSLMLMSYIVFWVGEQSLILGCIIAILVVFSLLIKPIYLLVSQILSSAPTMALRSRTKIVLSSLAVLVFIVLFVLPVPMHTSAQGVVWVPEQAQVRAKSDGFIHAMHVKDGEFVQPNQVLMTLQDPKLITEHDRLQSQLAGLEVAQYQALLQNPSEANNINMQMEKIQAEIASIDEKIAGLQVISQSAGTFVMPYQDDFLETFVKKGKILAYVLDQSQIKVRVAIAESAIALVRNNRQHIEVRLADNPAQAISARLIQDTPAATRTLPSAALGDIGGGSYITDPNDKEGLTTVTPINVMDLRLSSTLLNRVGTRAMVRFDLGKAPIATQLFRHTKQLFLRYFNPVS